MSQWLTIQHIAEQHDLDTKSVRRAIARGELKARRFGPRALRVSAESVANWGRPIAGGDAR